MARAKFSREKVREIIGDNCTEDMENQLVALHLGVVDPMKDDIAKYKADADKLESVQKELDDLKAATKDGGDYAKLKKEFDDYKAATEAEKTATAKKAALTRVAKDAGLSEAGIAKVVKYSDYSAIELNDDGEVKEPAALIKSLRDEWPEHVVKARTDGANTAHPPANTGGGKMTKDEIMNIQDVETRQRAIAENHELFGF